MISPSWPRDRAADAADVSAAAAADITAATTAAQGVAIADAVVGAVAGLDASVVDDPVAVCDFGHRRGAWWGVCRGSTSSCGSAAGRISNG